MKPILYETLTEGTVPSNYGLGVLSDCIAGKVKEARNSIYEVSFTYAADGIHAEDIQLNRFIKVKPNYTDDAQLFRIYKIGKTINGRFEVFGQHIGYDLSGKIITTGTASSCVAACALLQSKAGNFTINTDKTASGAFSIAEPSSVRSWFGGKQGSLLDVYGGEWKYDNYTATLMQTRGQDRGVTIRYGKNLTNLNQDVSIENLVTGIVPFYIDTNGNKTVGNTVPTGLVLDVPRDLAVDFSQDVNPESGTAITTQLDNLAAAYISKNNLTNAFNNITLDFVQLEGLTERVDLCDTVHIYFEPLGISATTKCIETEWDFMEERYTKVTFGSAKSSIADTIAVQSKEVAEAASRSYMADAITRATELITGNLGGYVILHDADGDGYPDEILIMNTPDIETATQVWRWNKNGLGYATTYAGPYGTAITSDGKIVADYVSTGTLNADLIKAGTIEDAGHNSTINMTTGAAVLNQLKSKGSFELLSNNVTKAQLVHTGGSGGTRFQMADATTQTLVDLWAHNGTGNVSLNNSSGQQLAALFGNASGGSLVLTNVDGTKVVEISTGSGSKDGIIYLFDNGGSTTINALAQSGKITCVSLVQTSSRKVKDNIKPMEDAEKILELEAVAFDYKDKAQGVNKRGFIAEDVAKIIPGLVSPETENTPAALDYVGMIPYLQDIIKKQEKRITALEEKINNLGG